MPRGQRGNRDARDELVSVLSCGFTCFHVRSPNAQRAGHDQNIEASLAARATPELAAREL